MDCMSNRPLRIDCMSNRPLRGRFGCRNGRLDIQSSDNGRLDIQSSRQSPTKSPARRRPRPSPSTAPSPSLPIPPAACGNALRQPNPTRAIGTTYLQGRKVRGTYVACLPCHAAQRNPAALPARQRFAPRPGDRAILFLAYTAPRPAEMPCVSRTRPAPRHRNHVPSRAEGTRYLWRLPTKRNDVPRAPEVCARTARPLHPLLCLNPLRPSWPPCVSQTSA